MSRLSERENSLRQAQTAGPQLTELGDPDFSPSDSSQGQVPGAAAQSRIFDNQRRAQNTLDNATIMGYDVNDPDFGPIRQQAEQGFAQEAGSAIGSLVGWIDGPRQAINLFIQDMIGGEAEPGYRNPNFGDYWNTLWGGMEDQDGFTLETGLNPVSGSQTLDMFGWAEAEEDDTMGRIFRGIADFGLQVATDPLTYVTFGLSGLGKKVALQTGRALQDDVVRKVIQSSKGGTVRGGSLTPYEKMLESNLEEIVNEFQEELLAKGAKIGGELPPEMQEAMARYLGREDNIWENITELALANKVHKDVIRPLVSRSFKDVDSLALDMLPAYAKGGARISVPFTRRTLESGILIPGTQGLGRKLVGDPMRALSSQLKRLGPYEKLAEGVSKGVTKMDQMAPLLRALKNGDIEGWQWHIAASAIDNMHNNVAKHTISTELNSQWNRIAELAGASDVNLHTIGADILMGLEGDNVSDVLLQQLGKADLHDAEMGWRALNPQLAGTVDETITYMQQVMESYHGALGALDPEFADKFIKGYIPHSPTKSSRSLITALAGTAAADSGKGDTAMDIMAQILNGAGRGGAAEPNMGTVRYTGRKVGKVQTLVDDGAVLIHGDDLRGLAEGTPLFDEVSGAVNPNALETRYLSTPQLNDLLEPVVRRMAHENGVSLSGWDGKLFNENPIDTMLEYIENMTDAINAWQTVESLTASGLAFRHQTELDVQQVIQNMFNNVVKNTSAIHTTHFGKPRQGQTEVAPISFLKSIVNPDDYDGALADIAGQARADDIPARDMRPFADDVAAVGVQEPVQLAVWEDGSMEILDGHHRIAAAEQAGITEIPFEVRRELTLPSPRNGVNVQQHLKSGWFYGNTEGANIAEDIVKNPGKYVFHTSPEEGLETIRAGGLYADREAAEDFVRHMPESGERPSQRVYVVDRAKLSPSTLGPIERGGQVGDVRGQPNIKPIGSYDQAIGPSSFVPAGAAGDLDDLTRYQAHEVFDTLPFNPQVVEERNLLHGAANQSGIAGVSRSVKMQIDDTKVISWNELEDVAETRRLVGRVNSTHHTDWAADTPTPDLGVSVDRDIPMHKWENYTDADGVSHQAFGPEDLNAEQKARAKHLRAQDKATKAKRAADKGDGKAPPKLTLQARHANAEGGAKLRFAPYEALNRVEKTNVWNAAHEWLDRAFQDGGVLEGMFTDGGINQLIESGLDEYTAEVLHSYVGAKIGSLGRDAVEFISKEPAEVFETRRLFDSWAKGLNDFVRNSAAVRTSDGKLIADTDKIALAGTKEVRDQLAELKRASQVLGSRGYDIAADVMANVEAYTGVQSIKDYVNPAHFNLAGPAVADLTMETNVAEWMSLVARNMGSIYTPEGIAAAKLAANETLKWWRAMATLPRPAFHIRNLVGGSWMNMAFGVKSNSMAKASRYGLAFRKALREASGPEGIEQAFSRLPKEMQNAWRAAWDHNVLAGFATTEFSNAVTPAGARGRWDWAKAWDVDNFALTRAGGKVMESVEDFLRMSMFLEYYDEAIPGSAKTAADMVNAVHFDYSNLTPTETKLKSIIPFFVWTRRNLPLQIQTAVENPRYVQRYRAMMQAMDDNLGGDEELPEADHFSAYAAGTSYKVNEGTPFWARVMIDPDLPIGDLLSIPNPEPGALIEYANNTLGPHISLISDINGQREFGDVNAPAPFNLVLQGLAAVGMYDRTMDGDVRIPYHLRTLMETAVPFTRELADPITGGPTDPGRQQRMGINPDDGFVEAGLKSIGGQLAGGLGVKMTTPADARAKAFRSDSEISELIESLRLQGKAPPIER